MKQTLDKLEQRLATCWQGGDKPLMGAVSLAALGFMLLAHGFAFANLFPNHDSTVLVFDAQWTMYVLGRWAQNLYFPLIRGNIAAPWLVGAFGTVYLALSGYCIARLLRLRRTGAVLLTGILAVNASVVCMLSTYTFETDAYLLALLLASVGVWCAVKLPVVPGVLLGGGCFCLCLALYQAYIQFALGLFLLLLARYALNGALDRIKRDAVRCVSSLGAGALLYLASVKLSLSFSGYELADGSNGMAQLGGLGPVKLLGAVPACWMDFARTLFGSSGWNDRGMRVAAVLLLLLALPAAVARLRGQKRGCVLLFLLSLLLLPLGLNCVYLLTAGRVYVLMHHAAFLFFALPLMLLFPADEPSATRPLWRWAAVAVSAFWLLRAVICANGAYVYTKLVYDNTARQMSVITAQIEQLPGYERGVTPVVFVGDFTGSALAYQNPGFNRYAEGDLHQVDSAITYDGTIQWWYRNVMGSTAKVQQGTLSDWGADARVQAMPSYPADGYCAIIEGTAIVKISDP